jgi:hypothetical protein
MKGMERDRRSVVLIELWGQCYILKEIDLHQGMGTPGTPEPINRSGCHYSMGFGVPPRGAYKKNP